jgi:signal transduction histidine kinase
MISTPPLCRHVSQSRWRRLRPLYIERGSGITLDRGVGLRPFSSSASRTRIPGRPARKVCWLLTRRAAAIERTRRARPVRRLQAESLRAGEEERRPIGRDLHDEAGQALALLRLQLELRECDAPERLRPRLSPRWC